MLRDVWKDGEGAALASLYFADVFVFLFIGQVREQIYEAFENIYPVLTQFRKIPQVTWSVTSILFPC